MPLLQKPWVSRRKKTKSVANQLSASQSPASQSPASQLPLSQMPIIQPAMLPAQPTAQFAQPPAQPTAQPTANMLPLTSLTAAPTAPPTQPETAFTPATGQKNRTMLDYWKQPVIGKIPLDRFTGLMGGIAYAFAPETPQGRLGRFLGETGQRMYETRLGRELSAADLAEKRRYEEAKAAKEWERGAPARALEQRLGEAKISAIEKGNIREQFISAYMKDNPGATFKEALNAYTDATTRFRPVSATAKRAGVPYELTDKEAFRNLFSLMSAKNSAFDETTNSFIVETDKKGNIPEDIKQALETSGFYYNISKDINVTDKPGWFTGDKYARRIYLGSFSPEKAMAYQFARQAEIEAQAKQADAFRKKGWSEVYNKKTGEMGWEDKEGNIYDAKGNKIEFKPEQPEPALTEPASTEPTPISGMARNIKGFRIVNGKTVPISEKEMARRRRKAGVENLRIPAHLPAQMALGEIPFNWKGR